MEKNAENAIEAEAIQGLNIGRHRTKRSYLDLDVFRIS